MLRRQVAGAVALLLSRQGSLTAAQVKARVSNYSESIALTHPIRTMATLNLALLVGAVAKPTCVLADLKISLSHRQFVEDLYCRILVRQGESAGVNYWTGLVSSGTLSRSETYGKFITSPEFRARIANLPKEESVSFAYQQMLGRKPESAGFSYWMGFDPIQLMSAAIESSEFRARSPFYLFAGS